MVQSDAETVDAYLAGLPEDRREAMGAIRDACREAMPGFTEVMAYGMPGLSRDGTAGGVEIAFASQKRYISFYLLRTDVRAAFEERLAGRDMGKGCLRFSSPARVDLDLVRDLAAATAASGGRVC
ncbi:iron chaperone [Glycomyces paridis]|uniref:DUF1801 domain-containing protein n=1 Tax=Glycomyces paridis TaxID=2126555 RepID=A0A4S8PQF3_9ACTN|nr:DUF1801 domain-containing protein [Glycomyces paridis]THV30759.1 DUF1801 domain-containing protein [Glycomyces paridis]